MRTPRSEIAHRFSYHPPTDERKRAHETVRQLCGDLAGYLDEQLPDSREKSLALTKLEEVMFFANASIAREVSS